MRKINVGIVGITGLVGQTILNILEKSSLPIGELFVYASSRSAGQKITFKNETYMIKALSEESFNDPMDIVFLAVDSDLSSKYAPIAVKMNIYVIDNSSAFRMQDDVPLIVPEVNGHILTSKNYLIANPNCSTIQSVVALSDIHKLYKITDVDYTTYQAVSGSGTQGLEDLENTTLGMKPAFYPKQIYNNVIPHIDTFLDNGYTKEEMKMVLETQKILSSKINVTATSVRVPVKVGHSVQIHVRTKKVIDVKDLIKQFQTSTAIQLYEHHAYPTPLDAEGTDFVHIGRIRKDLNDPKKLLLWTVADNVRKGAALNAVQIALHIYKEFIS